MSSDLNSFLGLLQYSPVLQDAAANLRIKKNKICRIFFTRNNFLQIINFCKMACILPSNLINSMCHCTCLISLVHFRPPPLHVYLG